jgi:hypothetical protein
MNLSYEGNEYHCHGRVRPKRKPKLLELGLSRRGIVISVFIPLKDNDWIVPHLNLVKLNGEGHPNSVTTI